MGFWQNSHLHKFGLIKTPSANGDFFSPRTNIFKLVTQDGIDADYGSSFKEISEDTVKLCDIWEESSTHRSKVIVNGAVAHTLSTSTALA